MAEETLSTSRLTLKPILLLVVFGMISFSSWLVFAGLNNQYAGFPLDDAWIHQTYARNLAELGQWAYIPDHISGGSTSPLWTLLLSGLHFLQAGPFGSAWTLGCFFFLGTIILGEMWARCEPAYHSKIPVSGIFLALEWHLIWSAVSGMETIFYCFMILLFFWQLSRKRTAMFLSGILTGVSIWVRPDAITLLGPAFFVALLTEKDCRSRVMGMIKIIGGLVCGLIPYLLFNQIVAGQLLPNTYFAKQTEYASMLTLPLISRLASLYLQPLIGASVLLLPGFLQQIWVSIRERNWWKLSGVLWLAGFILIYVFRLPVVYQHGRYLIPAMPVYFVLGVIGTLQLLQQGTSGPSWKRILSITWGFSTILLLLVFCLKGAQTYQLDVAVIHEEMVNPALWIREHTPEDAVIAAHDIGALGYFGERQIYDLAGLISPEIIPFLRDEDAIVMMLQERKIDYLMTFPDWYSVIPEYGEMIYQTNGLAAQSLGNTNMAIYRFNFK